MGLLPVSRLISGLLNQPLHHCFLCFGPVSSPNCPCPAWPEFRLELQPWVLPPPLFLVSAILNNIFSSSICLVLICLWVFAHAVPSFWAIFLLCHPRPPAFSLPGWFLLLIALPWFPEDGFGSSPTCSYGTLCFVLLITAISSVTASKLGCLSYQTKLLIHRCEYSK